MKKSKSVILLVCFLIMTKAFGQNERAFKIHTIAFYNLENLFDTINDPNKFDESSPIMEMRTGRALAYNKKIKNMARVIADIGNDVAGNSPAIIGVSEVENREVLEDLVNDSILVSKDYGIVHDPSPDARGIDVALLYQKKLFTPTSISSHELKIYDEETDRRIYTRNQLVVGGKLEGEDIYMLVNHWPSRSSGASKSEPKRIAAAKLSKYLVDSLQVLNPYAKIFIMGDLNDNPTNKSIKTILKTAKNKEKVTFKGIYNPFENLFRNGQGTTAFRDSWSLFDMIMVTKPLLEKDYSSLRFYQAGIFNKDYLLTSKGTYKGYPFRSWGYEGFTGGFSDHLPAYVYVIKEIPNTINTSQEIEKK